MKKLAVSLSLVLCFAIGEVRAADSAADSGTASPAVEAAKPKAGATAAPEEKATRGAEIAAVPTAAAPEPTPAGGVSATPEQQAEPEEKRPWWAPWRPDKSQEEAAAAAKAAAGEATGAAAAAAPTAAVPAVSPTPNGEQLAAASDALAREKNGTLAATLDAFCAKWMGFLAVRERDNKKAIKWQTTPEGVDGKYVGYSQTFKCFLKDIEKKETPVATIRYLEYLYEKAGPSTAAAESSEPKVVESTEVTEIFRYAKGEWVY